MIVGIEEDNDELSLFMISRSGIALRPRSRFAGGVHASMVEVLLVLSKVDVTKIRDVASLATTVTVGPGGIVT